MFFRKKDLRYQGALQQVRTPRFARTLAKVLLLALVLSIIGMMFVPWQQTARGTGRVVAYAPQERQRTVEAPIYGTITWTTDNFVEGRVVKKGEKLLEIQDNDPLKIARLEESISATERKLATTNSKAEAYDLQVTAYTDAKEAALLAADEMIKSAEEKLAAELQGQVAAAAEELQARLNLERQEQLATEGIKSGLTLEIEQRKHTKYLAKLEQSKNYVAAARAELEAKKQERNQKLSEADTKIEYAKAMYQDAMGQVAVTEKELLELQGKLSQQRSQSVHAPVDGIIFRIYVNNSTEFIKPATPLLTIVPEASDLAVEMFVSGNDMPLVQVGRHVRLQFEGWPAVQFAGWPSTAIGTFGGDVTAVDATDDGTGKFRVLIQPAAGEDGKKENWPDKQYLRQGVRANGWVMLNQVPIGYELWRQLNGFPPVLSKDPNAEEQKTKTPKLPK
jgi:multidrug efflux pump subunit AcrA (membrane-fusion protein)